MIKKIYNNLIKLFKKIIADEITVYAAQASYYICISAIPFIMLMISITGFIVPYEKYSVINIIQSIAPQVIRPYVKIISEEIFDKSIPILSITAITSLWSASRGVAAVERGIKKAYKINKRKNFFVNSATSILHTVIFMAVLTSTLLLQVFGSSGVNFIVNYINISPLRLELIKGILFFVLLTAVFLVTYYFLSGRKMITHLPGALFSSVGWMIFSEAFSIYIENFANYSYVYGSLTAVVLMMLWLYVCLIILLTGAEINRFIFKNK